MSFPLFTTGLANINFLGFLWVGDAITYFEFIYLPVVIILMILATFFIKQKDQKLTRNSQKQTFYTSEVSPPYSSSSSATSDSIPAPSGQLSVLEGSRFSGTSHSTDSPLDGFPQQIPA